ncbi:MAG: DUF2490 domain-containing protein [Bryobacteraceae bacterium]|nr:DUF2490 domain-containing protein [Bryobacteraceae bacterium]
MPSNFNATSEHRSLEQIVVNHRVRKLASQHRARFENRWISVLVLRSSDAMRVGWQYRNRYRQWLRVTPPIGDGRQYLGWHDEIWLHVAPVVGPNFFDPNRACGRLGWRIGEHSKSAPCISCNRSGTTRFARAPSHFSLNLYSSRPLRH